jgi:hypothetical protein
MYNLHSTLSLENYPGQSWKIEKRFTTCQERQYDNMPLIDHVTVAMDYDTCEVYTLIGCHATEYGTLSAESSIDKLLDCLYCPMLLVCHPMMVSVNYSSLWPSMAFVGSWSGETIAFSVDGILYVCSELVN